ncbi:MAG: hypothetical protein CSA89_01435 [Bacteroidales bacterium]|nr:MAG: hypothetical protein CSA89_01435 [Bacteroidales bacterium]
MLEIITKYPFIVLIITFIGGWVMMPSVLAFAKKHNLVVRPNKRTSHIGNVPNIGGLNIFLSLMIIFVPMLFGNMMNIYFFIGLFIMFLIGFLDDRLVLSAYYKLIGQTLCSIFLIYFANIRIFSLFGLFGIYELPLIWSYLLSYICYIFIINALNLIDGVDGLASGLGILYSVLFGIWFYENKMTYMAIECFAIVGSLSVFFLYNVFGKTKYKIFMGDSGSLALGYLITTISFVFIAENMPNINDSTCNILLYPYAPATVIAVLFIPIFDVIRVSITRIKQKKSIFIADKNHIHHLLLKLGFSHTKVTAIILSTSMIYTIIGILLKNQIVIIQIAILILTGCLLTLLLWHIINNKKKS